MSLTNEPFLNIDDNDMFCKNVFSLLSKRKNKAQLEGDAYQDHNQRSIHLLNEAY